MPVYITINSLSLKGNNIFAGTKGNGIWRRPLSEMIAFIEQTSSKIPSQYSLEQNYPNHFNPSTKISFSIPNSEYVTLKVYDVLGKEIATLVNEQLDAGSYFYNFDASKLTSGVYFYILRTNNFCEEKKMILAK